MKFILKSLFRESMLMRLGRFLSISKTTPLKPNSSMEREEMNGVSLDMRSSKTPEETLSKKQKGNSKTKLSKELI